MIVLNGNETQVLELQAKMEAQRAADPQPEKKKKRKNKAATGGAAAVSDPKKANTGTQAPSLNDRVTLSTAVAAVSAISSHEKSKKANPVWFAKCFSVF